jgi:predicted acyl esterase
MQPRGNGAAWLCDSQRLAKMRKTAFVRVCAAIALILSVSAVADTDRGKVSEPFRYSGYSEAQWQDFTRTSHRVKMRDGTHLTVDVLLPAGYTGTGAAATRFPVILRYTPYGRTFLKPGTEEIIVQDRLKYFLTYGYAVVNADMRGTGGSEGWNNRMSTVLREDGKEVVDWIAGQPWSTGKVGMIGGSYEGWSQLAVASMKPKALKAITPLNASFDGLPSHPGGILSYAFMQIWSAFTYSINHGAAFPPVPAYYPTPPVIDEDGDGLLADEVPVDLNGNGWLHDDYRWPLASGPTPVYADGVARKHHYYLSAIMQHHSAPGGAPGTFDGLSSAMGMQFRDSRRPGDGLTAPDLNWGFFNDIRDSGVAIMTLAGWFDPYVRSGIEFNSTITGSLPTRMVVSPAYHQGISRAAAAGLGLQSAADIKIEQLRWYDRWLKDIDNGVERQAPITFFVANAGWRNEKTWPLPGERRTRFYLDASSTLTRQAAKQPADDAYRADYTHQSAWNPAMDTAPLARINDVIGRPAPLAKTFLRNRQIMYGVPEGLPVRTQLDHKALVYTSAPLAADTDVIGHPIVTAWVSSTAEDGDFYFYLEDVDPSGQAVLVTEYQHRAGFSQVRSNDELIPGNTGVDVKPDLPWHGFHRGDYDPHVLADGKVAKIVTALYPTAWRFRKGHSIRLSVAASDWPTFELHPKLSPQNRPDAPDNIVPTIRMHRGGAYASSIELPIVP